MSTLHHSRTVIAVLLSAVCLGLGGGNNLAAPDSPMFPAEGPKIPLGLLPIIWPKDNPYSPQKAELGWFLYFDKRLSADGTISCASCHDPKLAFTDGGSFSKGI